MATQVGDGYIKVEPRFDRSSLTRQFGQAGRDAGEAFTKGFNRAATQQSAAFNKMNQERLASFRRANIQMLNETKRLRNELGRTISAGFEVSIGDGVDRGLLRARNSFNREGKKSSSDFWYHFKQGAEGILSLLPSRLEQLFTRTGPVMGTIFFAGFSAAILVGAPALGAMLGGAIMAGLGLGAALGAVLVGVAKDQRVKDAASRVAKTFWDEIIFHEDMQHLGQVVADQLDKINKAFKRLAPNIRSILQSGATFLPKLTDSLILMIEKVLVPLDRLMRSDFMKDIMEIFGQGLVKIGEAFGESFDRILDDPKAMEGMKLGLEDFFDLVAGLIKFIFDVIRKLSAWWADMNRKGEDGKSTLDKVRETWKQIKDFIDDIVDIIKEIASELNTAFGPGSNFERATGGFPAMAEDGRELLTIVKQIVAVLSGDQNSKNWWKGQWEDIKLEASTAWATIKTKASEFWGWLTRTFAADGPINTAIKTGWNNLWGWVKNRAAALWGAITGEARKHVAAWGGVFSRWWAEIRGMWNRGLTFLKTLWNTAWGWIKDRVRERMNLISFHIREIWNRVTAWLRDKLAQLRTAWAVVWEAVKQKAREIWNSITQTIREKFNSVKKFMSDTAASIRKGWRDLWTGMADFLNGIWTTIKDKVAQGINAVLGVINSGIDKINNVLGKLGVGFRIPKIPLVSRSAPNTTRTLGSIGGFRGLATGGPVKGPGTGTNDKAGLFRLSNGEHVWTAKEVDAVGGHQAMISMRNAAMGGRLLPGEGEYRDRANNGLLEQHRDHVHVAMRQGVSYILAMARRAFGSKTPPATSTFRPGDPKLHGKGLAVDFGGFNQDAFASFWAGKAGLMELIHRTSKRDYTFYMNGGGNAGPGGGFLGGIFEWLGKGWNFIKEKMLGPAITGAANLLGGDNPGNALRALGVGAIKGIGNAVTGKVKKEFDDAQEMMNSGDVGGASAEHWRATVIAALMRTHTPMSWVPWMLTLIARESGGNPSAKSFSSNGPLGYAIGLAQVLSGTFAAYRDKGLPNDRTNPLANLVASINYIKSRYGTIFKVSHANPNGPPNPGGYDGGGILPPGGTAMNFSSRPEMILNPGQAKALENRIQGHDGGCIHEIHNYIDGVEIGVNRLIAKNNRLQAQSARRGYQ